MFCQIVEYRTPSGPAGLRLLDDVYRHNCRYADSSGQGVRSEHRLRSAYALCFGEVDLLCIRLCDSLFPFCDLPESGFASMRRCLGFYAPSAGELALWASDAGAGKPTRSMVHPASELFVEPTGSGTHVLRPDPKRPLVGVVYVDLNRLAYILEEGDPKTRGPVRRALGTIAGVDFHDLVDQFSSRVSKRRNVVAPRVAPLLSLDRVSLALVVAASRVEDIAAVAWAVRQLRLGRVLLGDSVGRLNQLLGQRRFPGTDRQALLDNCALVGDTVSVLGAMLDFRVSAAPEVVALARVPGDGGVWTIGPVDRDDEPDPIVLDDGGFVSYVARPAPFDHVTANQLATRYQLRTPGTLGNRWYIGHIGTILTSRDVIRSSEVSSYRYSELRGMIRRLMLPGTSTGSSLPAPDALSRFQTTTLPYLNLKMLGKGSPSRKGVASIPLENSLPGLFRHVRAHHAVRRRGHESGQSQGWMTRWMQNSRSYPYGVTTSGKSFIGSVVQLLAHDLATFAEMAPVVERLLVYTTAESAVGVRPAELVNFFNAMERFLDSRRRQTWPLRRAPRGGAVFDTMTGYHASRQAFSACVHDTAALLGLSREILFLDESVSATSVSTPLSGVAVMRVISTVYLMPLQWRIGHEIGHAMLHDLSFPGHITGREIPSRQSAALERTWAHLVRQLRGSRTMPGGTAAGLLNDLILELHDRAMHPATAEVWRVLPDIVEEVVVDLAALFTVQTDSRSPPTVDDERLFWWLHGPDLVAGLRDTEGVWRFGGDGFPVPPERLHALFMILFRVFFVSYATEQARRVDRGESIGPWQDTLKQVGDAISKLGDTWIDPLATRPSRELRKAGVPGAAGFVGVVVDRLGCIVADLVRGPPTAPGDVAVLPQTMGEEGIERVHVLAKFAWAVSDLLEQDRRACPSRGCGSTGSTPVRMGIHGPPPRRMDNDTCSGALLDGWMAFVIAIQRAWPSMLDQAPMTADPALRSSRARARYIDYAKSLLREADLLCGDAGIPWLPCFESSLDSRWQDCWRTRDRRTPWYALRGGLRGRGAGDTFFRFYHEKTIQLLVELAHLNRARRYQTVSSFLQESVGRSA